MSFWFGTLVGAWIGVMAGVMLMALLIGGREE